MSLPRTEAELRLYVGECARLYGRIATGQVPSATPDYDRLLALQSEHDSRVALRKLLQRKYRQMTSAQIEREVIGAAAGKIAA